MSHLKIGENPEHPKLLQAKALLEENPAISRKSIRRKIKVSSATMQEWINRGFLKIKLNKSGPTGQQRCGVADHPVLKQVQEALAANPKRTITNLTLAFGVTRRVLRDWETRGWIKLHRGQRGGNTLYWLHENTGKHRPYDQTMVKVKK